MNNVYDLILPEKEKFKDYFLNEEDNKIFFVPKFNCINIIIGSNNSGKSRFIRNLMSFNSFEGVRDFKKIKTLVKNYNDNVSEVNKDTLLIITDFKNKANRTRYADGSQPDLEKADLLNDNLLKLLDEKKYKNILDIIEENKYCISVLSNYGVGNQYVSSFKEIEVGFYKFYGEIKRYYIPTLRTAHSLFNFKLDKFSKIENDIFLETLNNYYELDKIDVEVFTGVHLYKEILNTRNSKREIRQSFEKFEKFIGDYFFEKKKIDIVAEFNKDESLLGNNNSENISVYIEGERDSKKLYELGDGIQAIIILMYKIFMAESDSFIFIDEPELNLHPGMQRLFLEQITSNKALTDKNLTYVITTHSNHFLDLTIEKDCVSIYSFSPNQDKHGDKHFIIKNVNRGDNKLLQELGVNNSSVFMANCSIWVEGISDRNYIKAFLKSYCDSIGKSYPKEDIDFAFFEYAGSNIDHYVFDDEVEVEKEELVIDDIKALSLSNRIFLLADSDAVTKTKNKQKFQRLETLTNAESDNFKPQIIWDVREIENLLTNDIWQNILINFCNEKLVNQYREEIQSKIETALKKIDATNYKKDYVGNFLNDLRNEIGKKGNVYILNKSFYEIKKDGSFGTIINKRFLSEKVFDENFSWNILSENAEIKQLTIEIYDFITKR